MAHHTKSTGADVGLLVLRSVVGGLMAGHGAQKLFGSFGGYGLEGTSGWLESLGLKPGKAWAALAGGSEFGSGVLTALGFLTPIGAISMFGPMIMAWNKAHAGKPIWVTAGGAELPLTNMAIASAIALVGPGRFSIDHALDIEVPMPLVALTAAGVAAGAIAGMVMSPSQQSQGETGEEARDELQSGDEAQEQAVGSPS